MRCAIGRSARPGVDTAFDEGEMKIGRRLTMKILNASEFALGVAGDDVLGPDCVDVPVDRSMLAALHEVIDIATRSFDDFDYSTARSNAPSDSSGRSATTTSSW